MRSYTNRLLGGLSTVGGANNCARSKYPERLDFTPSKLRVVSEHRVDYSDLIAERHQGRSESSDSIAERNRCDRLRSVR